MNSFDDLIKDFWAYCQWMNYSNVKSIKPIDYELVLANDGITVLNGRTRIRLNNRLDFYYIAGTSFMEYDSILRKV